ncbi:MAG: 4a-hydroxytetrahydrobiopterin dehydratase [bacterium]|nr:4a-hydroxytetrahydrobiopterin dehydratase [bacterium]
MDLSHKLKELDHWTLVRGKAIRKTFNFKDFKSALKFVNKIGKIAEALGHHPDISIFSYNKVKITLTTHSIGTLSEKDFIVATKIDKLLRA